MAALRRLSFLGSQTGESERERERESNSAREGRCPPARSVLVEKERERERERASNRCCTGLHVGGQEL